MNTKQIIDLCSFVAMVAVDGYNKEKVDEWINNHPLPIEIKDYLNATLPTPRPTFIVTLRGTHVFHECSLEFTIPNTSEETLANVRAVISKKYNLEVYDFARQHGVLAAWTSDPDVKVFIEEI